LWYYSNMDFDENLPDISAFTSIDPTQPPVLVISNNSEPLVTIHPNGTIEYGPNYTPDETTRVFWEALGVLPKTSTDIREKFESLEADWERLDSKFGKDWTEWMDVRESIRELRALVVK